MQRHYYILQYNNIKEDPRGVGPQSCDHHAAIFSPYQAIETGRRRWRTKALQCLDDLIDLIRLFCWGIPHYLPLQCGLGEVAGLLCSCLELVFLASSRSRCMLHCRPLFAVHANGIRS